MNEGEIPKVAWMTNAQRGVREDDVGKAKLGILILFNCGYKRGFS